MYSTLSFLKTYLSMCCLVAALVLGLWIFHTVVGWILADRLALFCGGLTVAGLLTWWIEKDRPFDWDNEPSFRR